MHPLRKNNTNTYHLSSRQVHRVLCHQDFNFDEGNCAIASSLPGWVVWNRIIRKQNGHCRCVIDSDDGTFPRLLLFSCVSRNPGNTEGFATKANKYKKGTISEARNICGRRKRSSNKTSQTPVYGFWLMTLDGVNGLLYQVFFYVNDLRFAFFSVSSHYYVIGIFKTVKALIIAGR